MKKTLLMVAIATMLSSTAFAEDFDNTAIKMTAVTDDYSISIKSPETGATEFAVAGEVSSLDATVKW